MQTTTGVIHASGFNGYGQLDKRQNSERIINRFIEFGSFTQERLLLIPLWSRIVIGQENTLTVISGSEGNRREIEFEERIQEIAANEDLCLVLLSSHRLWKVDLSGRVPRSQFSFLSIESGLEEEKQDQEVPILITSTLRGFYAITNKNSVYSLPTRIGLIPGDARVTKLGSGLEHCLALLDNGDVFVWGGGLKGQLGLGELSDVVEPTLLEALSGIRIIEIAAGGWHSAALSEFGDLYVWGWNKQGQLGIPVKHQRSIYLLPEIVDVTTEGSPDPEEIELISCGSSHSIILTRSGKLFGTGNCAFGQLPQVSSSSGFIDQFTPISFANPEITKIVCGSMTSFIVSHVLH